MYGHIRCIYMVLADPTHFYSSTPKHASMYPTRAHVHVHKHNITSTITHMHTHTHTRAYTALSEGQSEGGLRGPAVMSLVLEPWLDELLIALKTIVAAAWEGKAPEAKQSEVCECVCACVRETVKYLNG
jgi:hypothetical protein